MGSRWAQAGVAAGILTIALTGFTCQPLPSVPRLDSTFVFAYQDIGDIDSGQTVFLKEPYNASLTLRTDVDGIDTEVVASAKTTDTLSVSRTATASVKDCTGGVGCESIAGGLKGTYDIATLPFRFRVTTDFVGNQVAACSSHETQPSNNPEPGVAFGYARSHATGSLIISMSPVISTTADAQGYVSLTAEFDMNCTYKDRDINITGTLHIPLESFPTPA